jgi:voltage-gated potassium channel Kch
MRIAYVPSGTELRFTAAPTAGHGVVDPDDWDIIGIFEDVGSDDNILVRTRKINGATTVEVTFEETFTAYRIDRIILGNGYTVSQVRESNHQDKTVISKGTETRDYVSMTFGDLPIIVRRSVGSNITVATNWHNPPNPPILPSLVIGQFAPVPSGAEQWDLRISATPNNNNVVRVVNVTAANENSINADITRYNNAHPGGTALPTVETGDSVIIPQGAGRVAVTVTVTAQTAATTRLNDATISFDIKVEAAETGVTLITADNGNKIIVATTTNLFGETVSVHINVGHDLERN